MCNDQSFIEPDESIKVPKVWPFIKKVICYTIVFHAVIAYSFIMIWIGYEVCAIDYPRFIKAKSEAKGGGPVIMYKFNNDRPYLTEPYYNGEY